MAFDLNNVPVQGKSLQERVELFVDECWEHCNSPAFQASMQILRGLRNEAPQELDKWLQVSLSSTVTQGRKFWLKMFSDIKLSKAEHQKLLNFVFSSLNGIVAFSRINQQQSRVDSDLQQLKALLLAAVPEGTAGMKQPAADHRDCPDATLKELAHIPGKVGVPVLGMTPWLFRDFYGTLNKHYENYGLLSKIGIGLQKGVLVLGPQNCQQVLLDSAKNFSSQMGYRESAGRMVWQRDSVPGLR